MKYLIAFMVCLLGLSASAQINGTNVTSGLVAHWKLDEGTGTSITSAVGLDSGAFVGSPRWLSGIINTALGVDGANYVTTSSNSVQLGITSNATYSCWIQPFSFSNSVVALSDFTGDLGVTLRIDSASGATFYSYPNNHRVTVTTVTFTPGNWYLLCGILRSSQMELWLNGILVGTNTLGEAVGSSSGTILLGRRHDSGAAQGFSKLDDVRIYNRALNAAEVYQLYTFRPQPTLTNSMANWANAKLVSYRAKMTPVGGASSQIIANGTWGNLKVVPSPLMEGLVLWWQLNESSGTTTADSSNQGNGGTLTNAPTWTNGIVGNCLYFNGSSQSVGGNNYSRMPSHTGTVSVWVNTAFTTAYGVLFDTGDFNADRNGTIIYTYSGSGGGILAEICNASTRNFININSTTNFTTNGWTHVCFTWDGSLLRLYFNGSQHPTTASQTVDSLNSNNPTIGKAAKYDARYFQGKLDDVRVYNRALSASEVQQLYQWRP